MQAILLMLIAVFFFSTMDVAFKMLVQHYSSFQVVFFRSVISLPFFFAWIVFTDVSQFKSAYPRGHILRGLLGLLMLFAVGECFREMQLADAYALFFFAPLAITLLSGPVLGEPAGVFRIGATLIGLAGVLLVLQPTGDEWVSYGAAMGLLGMLAYATSSLMLRRLGSQDGTATIAFWFVTIVCAGSAVLAIQDWQAVSMDHLPEILVLGLSGTFAQALLTAAFRRAPVTVVAPFDYTHMIWAVIFGFLFWDYLPGWRIWLGAGIIMLSGLFILYREHRGQMRKTQPSRRN